ncbi:thioredoxin TrxC [Colwellia sp. MEBiC06753]
MNITCSQCFTTNRIPADKDFTKAKCGKCKQAIYQAQPINLANNTFYPFIERNDLPIVIDFWASWCGPCQTMAPVFNELAASTTAIRFAKLNTEQAQEISANANIRSIPTLIFFHQGQEIERISGALNPMQMKQWLAQCLNKVS